MVPKCAAMNEPGGEYDEIFIFGVKNEKFTKCLK